MSGLTNRSFFTVIIFVFYASVTATANSASPSLLPKAVLKENRARLFFTPPEKDVATISEYIASRHLTLDELAVHDPNRILEAQISFNDYLNTGQVKALMTRHRLDAATLSMGWKDQVGGHEVRPNQPLEEALKGAALYYERLLKDLHESAASQFEGNRAESMGREELRRSNEFLAHAQELKQVFESRGVLYYGVKVKARSSKLKEIKDAGQAIRLVDPLWDSRESELGKTHLLTKIAIPIRPDVGRGE